MRKKLQNPLSKEKHFLTMCTLLGTAAAGTLASRRFFRSSRKKTGTPENELNLIHSDLLEAIAHDLRTPLSSIMGSSLIYRENHETLDEEEKLELVSHIQEDSSRMIDMAENLLAVSRLKNISQTAGTREEVLEEVLSEALQKLEKRHSGHMVHVSIPDDLILLPMDAVLVEQAVINLLENAISRSDSKKAVEVIVDDGAREATFLIRYYGNSIPENLLDGLFDCSSSEAQSCVGPAISKAIVSAHHGTIQCRNHEQGGEFIFTLPKRRCDSLR